MAINAIIDCEDKLKECKRFIQSEAVSANKHWLKVRQLFRCINDAIIWNVLTSFQKDASLFVRRACLNRSRGFLKDQNHEVILKLMWDLFNDGSKLPIWNDSTRCLDINDITLFDPHSGMSFIEVKAGKVNNIISEMMDQENPEEILADLDKFNKKFGQKGMKQVERIVKQKEVSQKLAELVNNDNVFDSFHGKDRKAVTPIQPLNRYDCELSRFLEELRSSNYITYSIDNCLHLIALNRKRCFSTEKWNEIIKDYFRNKMIAPGENEIDCSDLVLSLESSFDYPTAMPVMLRPWPVEDIAKICLGETEIYFGFDVNAWGRHLQSSHIEWSSLHEGRKELKEPPDERMLVVRGKIPQIVSQKGMKLQLGTQFFQFMLCEGICPLSLAAVYDQIINTSI